MHVDNVRELMSEVARNQSLLVDKLNSTVRQTLDTGKQLRTSPYIALNKHFNLFAPSVILVKRNMNVSQTFNTAQMRVLLYDK